jgi:hypothetical protein
MLLLKEALNTITLALLNVQNITYFPDIAVNVLLCNYNVSMYDVIGMSIEIILCMKF